MGVICIWVTAGCGRIGFDPLAQPEDDGSIPDSRMDDARMDDARVDDARADDASMTVDANALDPLPDTQITKDPATSSCPVIAWGNGEFIMAWQDQRDGNSEIYMARVDAGGLKIGADIRVTNDQASSQAPALVTTPSGTTIAWQDDRDGNNEIYLARYTPSASKIGSDTRITSDPASSSGPSLMWLGDSYLMAWQDDRDSNSEIYTGRCDAGGIRLGGDTRITNAPGSSRNPVLARTDSGFVTAWQDERSAGGPFYLARLDNAGAKIGGDVQLSSGSGLVSDVTLASSGPAFLVMWSDLASSGIRGLRFNAAGDMLDGERTIIGDPEHGSAMPAVVWNGSEYGVVWQDNRDGNAEIYMARLSPTGDKIGADIRVTSAPGQSACPALVWTGSEYGVAWQDDRDGNTEIYFTRVLP